MKHPTSRLLFAYWDALRGERAAPERAEIQPAGMRHVLADAFLLGRERGAPLAFRLAGSRIEALFMRELGGVELREIAPDAAASMADAALGDTVGVVAGAAGVNANGSILPLELLLLPLRHRGRPDTRMVGGLSPAHVPSWAGLVPLRRLDILSVRVLDTRRAALPATAPAFAPAPRAPFVVLDGGRA